MDIDKKNENGCMTVVMKGKFTFADNHDFRHIIEEIEKGGLKQVVFDLKALEFVDSAALGMLLLAQDEVKRQGLNSITLRNADGQVKKMISIARFDQYFTVS